jgi:hypothetical protein
MRRRSHENYKLHCPTPQAQPHRRNKAMTETETTKQEGHTATAERGGVGCSAVVRRRDRWKHTLNLLETVLTIQRTTLEQIATSGPNSTRDRRNARATIRFVNSLLEKNTQEPPNDPAQRPGQ